MSDKGPAWRRLLFLPPVLIGLGLLAFALTREPTAPEPVPERVYPVQVLAVERQTIRPTARGFGVVRPDRVFEATAEVAGRIVERHPDLERGALLEKGTLLFRIDPRDYRLAMRRIEAEIARIHAELDELRLRRASAAQTLELETEAVAVAAADLERRRRLHASGSSSEAAVDQARASWLEARLRAQAARRTLDLIAPRRAVREAALEVQEASLEAARLDLERTEIRLQAPARVARVDAETGRYAASGTVLAVLDGIERAEIEAQFPLSQMRPLIPQEAALTGLDVEALAELPRRFDFAAEVRLEEEGITASWPARVARLSEGLDPQSRSLGLIVTVDEPLRSAIPGERPPLAKNMHVEIILRGPPQAGRLVIPRTALDRRNGEPVVHLANDQDRLETRTVDLDYVTGDRAVLNGGLEPGERVILSDLETVIEGMALEIVADESG